MKQFKVKIGFSRAYDICDENFARVTDMKKPYVFKNKYRDDSLYAICPACDNPIQIIGLFKNTEKGGKTPFGRHNQGEIPGLATYDEAEYLDCPYANPNRANNTIYRRPESKISAQTLELCLSQFDRAIYLLQRDIDIYIGKAAAEKLLNAYIRNEGYRYRAATMYNIPWILGETAMANPIFGRKILKGSELHIALSEKCPEVAFVGKPEDRYLQVKGSGNKYVNLSFVLGIHKFESIDDGEDNENVRETVILRVCRGNAPDQELIYSKKILIRPDYFMNLVNLPEERAKRNKTFMEIADRMRNRINNQC